MEPAQVSSGNASPALANADAERAVLRVKQKLMGLEGGACVPLYVVDPVVDRWLMPSYACLNTGMELTSHQIVIHVVSMTIKLLLPTSSMLLK